jgi:hypothetical protein
MVLCPYSWFQFLSLSLIFFIVKFNFLYPLLIRDVVVRHE